MLNLPNILTLINLFFGACAVIAFFNGHYLAGTFFIGISSLADFFDGFVARFFKTDSEMGKQLDSLADMVSFGLVPGLVFYKMLEPSFPGASYWGVNWYAAPGFILTCFACLRLAKFNLDTRQSESFIGLNTPATTIFVIGLMLIWQEDSFGLSSFVSNPIFIYSTVGILSYLLISEIPFFSLKLKSFGRKGNEFRFILLAAAVVEIFLLKEAALSVIILTYLLLSVFGFKRPKEG